MAFGCEDSDDECSVLERKLKSYKSMMNLKDPPGVGDDYSDRKKWIQAAEASVKRMHQELLKYSTAVHNSSEKEDLMYLLHELECKKEDNLDTIQQEKIKTGMQYLEKFYYTEQLHRLLHLNKICKPESIKQAMDVQQQYAQNGKDARKLLKDLNKGEKFYTDVYFKSQSPPTSALAEKKRLMKMTRENLSSNLEISKMCSTAIHIDLCHRTATLGMHSTAALRSPDLKFHCMMMIEHNICEDNMKKYNTLLRDVLKFVEGKLSNGGDEVERLIKYIKDQKARITQMLRDSEEQRCLLQAEETRHACAKIPNLGSHIHAPGIKETIARIQVLYQSMIHYLAEISYETDIEHAIMAAKKVDQYTKELQELETIFKPVSNCGRYARIAASIEPKKRLCGALKRIKRLEILRRVSRVDDALRDYQCKKMKLCVKIRHFAKPQELDLSAASEQQITDSLIHNMAALQQLMPISHTSFATIEMKNQLLQLKEDYDKAIWHQKNILQDIKTIHEAIDFFEREGYEVEWYCQGSYDNAFFLANLYSPNISAGGHKAMQELSNKRHAIITVINIGNRKADLVFYPEEIQDGEGLQTITIAVDNIYSYVVKPVVQDTAMPDTVPLLPATLHRFQAPFHSQETAAEQLPLPFTIVAVYNTQFRSSIKANRVATTQTSIKDLEARNQLQDTLYLRYENLRHDELIRILATLGQSDEEIRQFVLYIGTHGRNNIASDIRGDEIEMHRLKTVVQESIKADSHCIAVEACRVVHLGSQGSKTANSTAGSHTKVGVLYMCKKGSYCHLTNEKCFRFPIELSKLPEKVWSNGILHPVEVAAASVCRQNEALNSMILPKT